MFVDAELAEKQRARDEVAWMLQEARALARAEGELFGDAPARTRARRRPVVWLAVLVTLVGIGGFATYRATRSTQSRAETLLGELAHSVDAICTCRDAACVDRFSADMAKSGANQKPPTFDEAQTKRETELVTKASECMMRALSTPPETSIPTQASASEFRSGPQLAVTRNGEWYIVRQPLPDAIDRAMIATGLARVRSQVRSCRDHSPAEGTVKVHVKVDVSGKVTAVHVEDSPDPYLGACVAAAVARATFVETRNGGSFSYPFDVNSVAGPSLRTDLGLTVDDRSALFPRRESTAVRAVGSPAASAAARPRADAAQDRETR